MPPPKPLKENIPSPAKPILATPPRDGVTAFFFHNKSGLKTHGLTPGGKTVIPLQRHEGPHHRRVRSDTNPRLIVSGDHPLSPSNKNKFEPEELHLCGQLINLKKRSDHDYSIYKNTNAIDASHFEATIIHIEKSIKKIKTCYTLAENPIAFLAKLNQLIEQDKAYNPFGLEKIYNPIHGYDIKLAEDDTVFKSAIQINDIIPQQAACAASLEKRPPSVFVGLYEGIDEVKSSGSPPPRKRRLEFLSSGDGLAKEELAAPSNPKI